MKKHETVIILKPDLTEDEKNTIIQSIKDKVNEKGAVEKEINREERQLAYQIKGYNRGYYIDFQFYMQTSLVKEIEIFLRSNQNVIKYIIMGVVE